MTLIYLVMAWMGGIGAAPMLSLPVGLWLGIGVAALVGLIAFRARAISRIGFSCVLLFTLGAARWGLSAPHLDETSLATYNGIGFVTLEGVINDAPDVRDTQINLSLQATSLTLSDGTQIPIRGAALVQAPRVGSYRYGDQVRIRGQLTTPPHNDDFSYRDYLARQGIGSLVQYAQVDVIGPRQGNPIRAALLDFRDHAHQMILRLLPDPQASLLAGILLGIETGISPEVRDAFNAVGATHVIAISGSNLAIIAGLLWSISRRFLPERWSATLTITGILLYTAFVGGDAAVLRAAIMTTLGLVATQLGRQTYGLASLSFAALLLTAINPLTLWDVGFQLSFTATLGLILYVGPLQKLLEHGLSYLFAAETAQAVVGSISDAFVVTVAAQITTAPVLAYHFARFSLISLPVNFLIIPAQTPLMVLGGLGVLVSLVVLPLGQVIAWGSWVFLSYTIAVVRFFAQIPTASLETPQFSTASVLAFYIVLIGGTWMATQPETDRKHWFDSLRQVFRVKAVVLGGAVIVALLLTAAASLPDDRLHVTFIDVGNGAATLIVTPSGRHILVDAGGSGRSLSTTLGDELPFWDRRIDLVVVPQPTAAHTSGLLPILSRYQVDAVLTNGGRGNSEESASLWAVLDEQGTREVAAEQGMRIAVDDGVVITIIQTGAAPTDSDPGAPPVLLLTYGSMRLLFTGDLSAAREMQLMQSGQLLTATVLQVPQSGHRDANGEDFLQAVHPSIAILSSSSSRGDLPHPEVLERLRTLGIVLYRTDQIGNIHLKTDGENLWIREKP